MAERTDQEQLREQVGQLLEAGQLEQLRALLAGAPLTDIAEVIEVLDTVGGEAVFGMLEQAAAGEVLDKVDEATRIELMGQLAGDELGGIVATLPPDEAADVLADLSEDRTEEVFDHMGPVQSRQVEALLYYAEDSAGGIMNPVMITVGVDATIDQALEAVRKADPEEDFFYVFVVDSAGGYRGAVGMRTLLRCEPGKAVSEVLEEELPAVGVDADQEEVANEFRKYDLMVMPVVDAHGVLVGRITVDDVVEVMDQEAEEDVLVMAGTHPAELDRNRAFRAAGIRLPWLMTCLIGSMVSALVISFFGTRFSAEQWVSVFMFVPAIAAMGGNSGLQTATIVVRGLGGGHLAGFDLGQVFRREGRVAVIVAVVCGLLAGMLAGLVQHLRAGESGAAVAGSILAVSVGLAMFCGIILATSLGMVLPFVFRRIGIDPAISCGPLVTTINDVLSYASYFTVSLVLLGLFGG